ncbi:DUF5134 domain-containing protein [Promicromonospora sp. NPDC052451]|uniref:DUF5134 domain-containing protein n=1 Tax=unclassified Promicromonospora TaxID=2647929 RepID=UPI0037CA9B36
MTAEPVAQWAMTAVFGGLGVRSLWWLAAARLPLAVAEHLLHLGMSLVMVAMMWPWWVALPVLPQVAFFALGAGFFAALAAWRALEPGRGADAGALAVHAVMMLAMVWAVAVMGRGPAAHHAAHGPHPTVTDGAAAWGAALVVALVVGTVVLLVHGAGRERGGADHLAGALMSGGTVVMCVLMLTG